MDVLIANHRTIGLDFDAVLLKNLLQTLVDGEVMRVDYPDEILDGEEDAVLPGLDEDREIDTLVFMEHVFLGRPVLRRAGRKILIPNPEMLTPGDIRAIETDIDEIWTKTRDAYERMSRAFPRQVHRYVGWTSEDILLEGVAKDYSRCIHIKGASYQKQTELVLRTWMNNPDLPELVVINSSRDPRFLEFPFPVRYRQVTVHNRVLAREELKRLANRCAIHICTSCCEGFGHYINEARSCGSLIVTTDAPPMNELVSPDFGFPVPPVKRVEDRLSCRNYLDEGSLAAAVRRVVELPLEFKERLSRKARDGYVRDAGEWAERVADYFVDRGNR